MTTTGERSHRRVQLPSITGSFTQLVSRSYNHPMISRVSNLQLNKEADVSEVVPQLTSTKHLFKLARECQELAVLRMTAFSKSRNSSEF